MKQLCSQADYRGLELVMVRTPDKWAAPGTAITWPRVACHVSRVNVMGTPGVIISPESVAVAAKTPAWMTVRGEETSATFLLDEWASRC